MFAKRKAFTLVELLVVIGIITVLISILLPALNKARQTAVQLSCLSNVRQIALGAIQYANDSGGAMPGVYYNFTPNGYEWQHFHVSNTGQSGITSFPNGGPVGLGLLVYTHYLANPKVCFCPGRGPTDNWGWETNYSPQSINLSPNGDAASWNPGLSSFIGWINVGYIMAVTDSNPNQPHDSPGPQAHCNFGRIHKLGKVSPLTPMVMDVFGASLSWGSPIGFNGQRMCGHGQGISIAAFDGSATFGADYKDILDTHFGIGGQPGGIPGTEPSGSVQGSNEDRWYWQANNNINGNWPSGIAWVEHYMQGMDDGSIKRNTPDW